ncbi:MAG TPA: glycoside hydrolase family 36 protein [Terriglobales bacterium]|nr:glycoside hydrolase family 36 protein [Terriglobales bacterium]
MKRFAIESSHPQFSGWLHRLRTWAARISFVAVLSCPSSAQGAEPVSPKAQVEGNNLRVEFDHDLRSRVIARFDNHETPLGPFAVTESVATAGKIWAQFPLISQKSEGVRDSVGTGQRLTVAGNAGGLTKTIAVTVYDDFPTMAVFDVQYTNTGRASLAITKWVNNGYTVNTNDKPGIPPFWSYQSGSYEKRPNWVVPLKAKFWQENYLGMNASDYGGGTPVVDVWRRDVGIAVGHVELRPKLVSLPVSMPDFTHARIAVESQHTVVLKPGDSFHTLRTFVAVHQKDYFRTLVEYRRFMMAQGLRPAEPPVDGQGAMWCAWGYGRTVRPQQVYDTLPTVKRLGFKWVTLDDGWQNNVGDWALDPGKFPNRDADMRALVDRIHQEGFRAQLWWSPLSAVSDSELLKTHSDYVLLNEDGSKRTISWWNSYYLCPADRRVVEYHKALVRRILSDWGFDGLKLDGQHMNGAPACYNPAHHHASPEDSVEAMPDFFREIYETAQSVKPGALVEFCPCGTSYSFFTMPYFNMSVASDPTSSFQVRSKAKTLKALMGDDLPFFGDHVELSDGGNDFASTMGVGGVIGTQFVLPSLVRKRSKSDLTSAREADFEKWLRIYRDKMLSQGQYLGQLYDIGFDLPETHVILRDQNLYYAFFAKHWKGRVELRGLGNRNYSVHDYVNGTSLGTVPGRDAWLPVEFDGHLLLEARPE